MTTKREKRLKIGSELTIRCIFIIIRHVTVTSVTTITTIDNQQTKDEITDTSAPTSVLCYASPSVFEVFPSTGYTWNGIELFSEMSIGKRQSQFWRRPKQKCIFTLF
ncbi:hypothetical protein TNCV_3317671 [Trichonephila clavipes]|nr:hypothetical protein TNCV_3317671 [Trichonephila clavipes]